jgi:hypothetical protein
LESEINRFVNGHRKVRRYDGCFEPRAEKWIEDNIPDTTHLPQTGPEQNWRQDHLIIQGVMGAGRVTETPNIISQDTSDKAGGRVGHKTHGIADPVPSVKSLLCSCVLIDQDGNGIFVIEFNLLSPAPGTPTIDGVGRKFADPHQVGPKKIGGFFDMPSQEPGIIREGSLTGRSLSVYDLSKGKAHVKKGF